ncbi:MAG: enoyl-CoA hydratase/isomerase family protein [Betaproteobacteria bacterium]|nr:MAG: enoyl-CoA hydratase/isomerase family protein [Betaproteobacteria bacterium]
MSDLIVVERIGAVATVVLNQPARLNALSQASWRELGARMRELSADSDLRCVILRGAGVKAFAAGADIAEFPTVRADAAQGRAYGELIHAAMQSIGSCVHPTIAMIRGACIGGGLELALMCDLRICGESSRFGIPINRLGLTMGYGELTGLLAVVGPAVALEILLEGRVFGAQEAHSKRLVHRVVADERVESEVHGTAQRIVHGAPLVARWHKRFIRRLALAPQLSSADWNEGFACFDTEDYREGLRAFLSKQTPQFTGR